MIIAIDGPAASGKTTIARRLAVKLNMKMIDSGSLYRSVALQVIRGEIEPDDAESVIKTTVNTIGKLKVGFVSDGEFRISIDGDDITGEIRSPAVNEIVSPVSELADIRSIMVDYQRRIAGNDAVVEGRDIGTVVFPDAGIKIYLDADIKERARRRFLEQVSMGIRQTVEEVREDIERRDGIDSERESSPLRRARDAIYIDTTGKEIEAVVDEIISRTEERK